MEGRKEGGREPFPEAPMLEIHHVVAAVSYCLFQESFLKMQTCLKGMAQQFRINVYFLSTYSIQGSVLCYLILGKSLTPWRVGVGGGDKWKRGE